MRCNHLFARSQKIYTKPDKKVNKKYNVEMSVFYFFYLKISLPVDLHIS